jgi:hypothetical protein
LAPIPLVELADATAKAFAQVAGRLSDVRGASMDLCARLGDLDRVLVGQSGNVRVLAVVETGAASLRTALADGSAVAAPARLIQSAVDAGGRVAEIITRTKQLDAVASLTLITARSLDLPGFEDYVRDLRSHSSLVRDDAGHLGVAVAALRGRREAAAALYGQAGESLDRVLGVFGGVADERAATEAMLARSLAEVSALAARLPEVAEAETASLVRAMQFADSVAQRLDHAEVMLSRPEPVAQALARAQIAALVADTLATGTDVAGGLRRIEAQVADAARTLSAGGNDRSSPATQALDLGRQVLSEVAEGSRLTLTAVEATAAEAETLRRLSDEASQRFASLAQATGAIHIAAINAVLLARRDDGQERAMTVLSVEVRELAAACASASAGCREAIAHLSLPDDLRAFTEVADRGAAFRRAVGETEGAVGTAGQAMVELDRLRQAAEVSLHRLGTATTDARQALERLADTATELSELAASLPDTSPVGAAEAAHLMSVYTMEAERAVHRRFFGLPEPTAAAKPTTEEDMLAAVLF